MKLRGAEVSERNKRLGLRPPSRKGISQNKNENNGQWKGEKVKVKPLHRWINRNFGTRRTCEHCFTTKARRYDWSSKDHKYTREQDDWQRLCRSCHQKYDHMMGFRKTKNANKRRKTTH